MTIQTRILIVEDEAIIAMDLEETLIEAGYLVIAAVPSGEEALTLSLTERADIVLMDFQLQGRLNGIETAKRLKEFYAIPSVLLTSSFDAAMLAASQQAGIFAYLVKPFEERELCATLATALSQARNEVALRQQIAELSALPLLPEVGAEGELKIFTLSNSLSMEFRGTKIDCELFTRTQRELLSLLLSKQNLRLDRETIEEAFWPDTPASKARSSFDAFLSRLRKVFSVATESEVGMELLSLKNGFVTIENCSVDLHRFQALDAEGTALRRNGRETEAIAPFVKAIALWKGEFLAGLSTHHDVLTIRQQNTQRVFEVTQWLAEAFTLRQRTEEQIEALRVALQAVPTSEKVVGLLYSILIGLDRVEQGKSLLKNFARELGQENVDRKEIYACVRRIELKARLDQATRNKNP